MKRHFTFIAPRAMRALAIGAALLACVACSPSRSALDRLHACAAAEGPHDAYCGTLTVLENPAATDGRKIDLKIVVAPAVRRGAAPDPVFVLLDGPQDGAASTAERLLPLFAPFQADRDIVFVDQRGTGASNSLACVPAGASRTLTEIAAPPIEAFSDCSARLSADLRFYTTMLAADDLDAVRQHLGYERINLWGLSYGARLALIYMWRHEPSVRSAVLDSAIAPDQPLPLYWARDGQRALDRLFAACAADAACNGAFPNLTATLQQVLDRAAAQLTVDPRTGAALDGKLTRELIAGAIFNLLYSTDTAAKIPRLLSDAAGGDFQGLLASALQAPPPSGAFLSAHCTEDVPRFTRADLEREGAGTLFGTTAADTLFKGCDVWPKGEVDPLFYEPISWEQPVLVLSGEEDPVAPPAWGEKIVSTMSYARQLVVPATGNFTTPHGCVSKLIAEFLMTTDAPKLDASCLDELRRPPFAAAP